MERDRDLVNGMRSSDMLSTSFDISPLKAFIWVLVYVVV